MRKHYLPPYPLELEKSARGKQDTVHSRKECWCGGHNHNNASRNLNHHGTRNRLLIRRSKLYRQRDKERALTAA